MRWLRVGLDISALELTRAGTARYLEALRERLRGDPEIELVEYTTPGESRGAKLRRDLHWYPRLARRAAADRVDVLHCPTQRAPTRCRVPLVVTVHDLAVLRHPRAFNAWTRGYSTLTLPSIAREADHVITGSRFTQDELVQHLNVPTERITVINYGVGPPFEPWGPHASGRYVLAVSTLEPRKNLARTIQGFQRARLGATELRLVGLSGWGAVNIPHDRHVTLLGRVDDDELAALYRGALCVVYLSLYEGFGLPPLEAMASGHRRSFPLGRPTTSLRRAPQFRSTPPIPMRLRRGSTRRSAGGSSSARQGPSARAPSRGTAPPKRPATSTDAWPTARGRACDSATRCDRRRRPRPSAHGRRKLRQEPAA